MEAKLKSLPPLKRFTLLQQQQREENKENNGAVARPLPAKKRKESREPLSPLQPTTKIASTATSFAPATYCLPAKKRIWAPPPEFVPGKTLSPFDLNVEYKPSSIEEVGVLDERRDTLVGFGIDREDELVKNSELPDGESDEEGKEGGEEETEDGILCAVCQSTDGDALDPIVFCDGCDLMVHVTCYGNPLVDGIPEGDWYCAQCVCLRSSGTEKGFSCCLCNKKGGALKRTTNEDVLWAHLVCALYVPEVFFEDPDGREGIDCSKVPKRRWDGKCYLCKSRKGCVIECSELKCELAFHVTCGLSEDLCIEYKVGKKKKETIVAGFCKAHSEIWEKQQHTGKFKIVAKD